jgi:hypothetical protein
MEYLRDAVPEKCLTCPMVIMANERIETMNEQNDQLILESVGSDADAFAQEFARDLKRGLGETEAGLLDGVENEIAAQLREMNGNMVNRNTIYIKKMTRMLGEYSLGCVGPLTMQAAMPADTNRIVQARICMSAMIPETSTEPAVIKRFNSPS